MLSWMVVYFVNNSSMIVDVQIFKNYQEMIAHDQLESIYNKFYYSYC